jgi:hypothetical protein
MERDDTSKGNKKKEWRNMRLENERNTFTCDNCIRAWIRWSEDNRKNKRSREEVKTSCPEDTSNLFVRISCFIRSEKKETMSRK